MKRIVAVWLACGALAVGGSAQTRIDLRSQGRNVDFSGASSTKPFRTGTQLPATCSAGEAFFKTDAAAGQNWYACASANVWTPQSGGGAGTGAPNYAIAFTGQTTVTAAGTAHQLGSANLIVTCYNGATPAGRVEPDSVTVHPSTFDVTITFAVAQTGRCVINGTGGGAAGNAVTSAFGRTGTVLAQTGDYSFAQISGSVANSQIAAGVDASKIAGGSVTNTAFGYLANATANIQQQVDAKAAAGHSHATGGDLAGDVGNATVARIQSRAVAAAAPANGQALLWDAGSDAWRPGTVVVDGGAGMGSQLGDFAAVRTSGTVLAIGANCSVATPCNVRMGTLVYGFTQGCTATISAGSGTAYIYASSGGTLTVGHTMTVAASGGCVAQSGVTAFPPDAIPLYLWTAAGGTWDAEGGTDERAWLSAKQVSAGTGVTTVESSGRTTVSVDAAMVPTFLTTTAGFDFASIAAGTCSADLTLTLSGAAATDGVVAGWPAAMQAGLLGIMRVSAANTIAVRLCNHTASAIDPAAATYRATIVRSF